MLSHGSLGHHLSHMGLDRDARDRGAGSVCLSSGLVASSFISFLVILSPYVSPTSHPKEQESSKKSTQAFLSLDLHVSTPAPENQPISSPKQGPFQTKDYLKKQVQYYFHKIFDFKLPFYICYFVLMFFLAPKDTFVIIFIDIRCY